MEGKRTRRDGLLAILFLCLFIVPCIGQNRYYYQRFKDRSNQSPPLTFEDDFDYYEILDVSPTASEAEIKSAYRKMAKRYHPDVSAESNAEEIFMKVSKANEILSDSKSRKEYDNFKENPHKFEKRETRRSRSYSSSNFYSFKRRQEEVEKRQQFEAFLDGVLAVCFTFVLFSIFAMKSGENFRKSEQNTQRSYARRCVLFDPLIEEDFCHGKYTVLVALRFVSVKNDLERNKWRNICKRLVQIKEAFRNDKIFCFREAFYNEVFDVTLSSRLDQYFSLDEDSYFDVQRAFKTNPEEEARLRKFDKSYFDKQLMFVIDGIWIFNMKKLVLKQFSFASKPYQPDFVHDLYDALMRKHQLTRELNCLVNGQRNDYSKLDLYHLPELAYM
eukprot:maker-scaffold_8-snap-gene-7.16-mRNA-1 protein AED:0.01 eAED:0.01 QI:30/1/1/1/1/1/3/66/386